MDDNLAPKSQISGMMVAGVVYDGSESARRPRLSANIPADWRGEKICVRLVSGDGRYVARKNYTIKKDWKGGPGRLPFASPQYDRDLAGFAPGNMAVAVRRGDCEASMETSEASAELSVASWNSDAVTGDAQILINSFGADEAYIFVGDEPTDRGCAHIKGRDHLAYDFRCTVPAAALRGEGKVRVEINRVRAGNFDEPEIVSIARTGG